MAALAAAYVTATVVGGIGLGWYSLHPKSPPIRAYEERNAAAYARERSIEFQDVDVTAADGTVLRAWYMWPPQANGDSVRLLHGWSTTGWESIRLGSGWWERGYTVLMPDARHHGSLAAG